MPDASFGTASRALVVLKKINPRLGRSGRILSLVWRKKEQKKIENQARDASRAWCGEKIIEKKRKSQA